MKKLKQKGIGGIVSVAVFVIMFVFIKVCLDEHIAAFDYSMFAGEMIVIFMLYVLGCGLAFLLSQYIHILIHEAGHLFFGLLSGYKFLSFRIDDKIYVKQDGRIVKKRYELPGTAGQCLMWPPEYDDGKYPYLLYNLGGGLMNIIVCTVVLISSDLLKERNVLWIALKIFAYSGYATAVINLFPMRLNGLGNDGYNILGLVKSPHARESFWRELHINAATTSGRRYSELDPSLYDITGLEITDMADVYVYAVNADVCMEKGEYEKALEIVDMLLEHPVVKGSSYSNSLKVSKACLMMDLGYDEEQVKEVISEDVLKYVNTIHYMPSAKIFEYKCELYINKDINAALIKEEEFMKSLENSPNLGVNELEKQLFLSFKEKYFAKFSESDV